MTMNMHKVFLASFSILLLFSMTSFAFAHPHSGQILIDGHSHSPQTTIVPLNGIMGLEKTTLFFHAAEHNTLPWAFVEGKIANHVEGYPAIIQIFQNNEPVHFAQTHVSDDGSYEYKFRVLNSENGHINKIFKGDYSVKIFKVVYLNHDDLI